MVAWALTEYLDEEDLPHIEGLKRVEHSPVSFTQPDVPEAVEPMAHLDLRRSMERTLSDVGAALEGQEFDSIEQANAFLRELLQADGVPGRAPETPLDQAQDLMYQAWETPDPRRRIRVAREALQLSPDCADAYVLLAEESAGSLKQAIELYTQGVAAGSALLARTPSKRTWAGSGASWRRGRICEHDWGLRADSVGGRPAAGGSRARLGLASAEPRRQPGSALSAALLAPRSGRRPGDEKAARSVPGRCSRGLAVRAGAADVPA